MRLWLLAVIVVGSLGESSIGQPHSPDWLVHSSGFSASVKPGVHEGDLSLDNGLVRRVFRVRPNWATVALDQIQQERAEIRSVRPEASITIDGHAYPVGGLVGQPVHNYLLPGWIDSMAADPHAFRYRSHRVGRTKERFAWKPRSEWLSSVPAWPSPGVSLDVEFEPPAGEASLKGVSVVVHYELYDGLPVLSKWITVSNGGDREIVLDSFAAELLATVEPGSMVGGKTADFAAMPRMLQVETDYSFGGSMDAGPDGAGVHWGVDPLYETQVNYDRQTPCLLTCSPTQGPAARIAPGSSFESFRVFELLHDCTERERRGLAARRMYRAMAPWSCENPLIFHVRSAKPDDVRAAIDQAAAVGFELIIMTFGSGFNIEDPSPANLDSLRSLGEYAHSKGIALGGYSLLASRSIDAASDVVNPKTGKPGGFATFGNSPCLGSEWGLAHFRTLHEFFERTGLDVLEHDGSYPGDFCASTSHPGHRALADSQWTQWRTITQFYRWCRARGIYLNVPDWYFMNGSNKTGMGYRETNWSLPRAWQEIIERQNIHDGTWTKTPSMGWMFVPLTEYQGGGKEATIEPLDEHLDHYRTRLMNLLGAGVQACYRGPRLYDTDRTREMVKSSVAWFKAHRAILESDIIHGRRPDGRDLDWLLHVNPLLEERGMLVVYNPTDHPVERTLSVDLHYTGLRGVVKVIGGEGHGSMLNVDGTGLADVRITVPAHGVAWRSFRQAELAR